MHKLFGKRLFGRRVVALAAAYAIALSGLIASFGAVPTAIAGAASPGIVICQHSRLGQNTPAGHHGDCSRSCCIGCLTLLAAVPPPPTEAAALVRSPGQLLALRIVFDLPSNPQTKSHRSRGPPQPA